VAVSWKTPVTLLVLLLVLLGAAFYGWRSVVAPAPSDSTSASTIDQPACTKHSSIRKGQRIFAADVVVNVYNAGSVPGLAAATSSRLTDKGFRPGVVADAPSHVSASNVTILSNSGHSPEVRLVAKQFKGSVVIRKHDLGAGIDVVLGNKFQAVDPKSKAFLVVHKAVRTCVRAGSATP
jgi:hypothetical protein